MIFTLKPRYASPPPRSPSGAIESLAKTFTKEEGPNGIGVIDRAAARLHDDRSRPAPAIEG